MKDRNTTVFMISRAVALIVCLAIAYVPLYVFRGDTSLAAITVQFMTGTFGLFGAIGVVYMTIGELRVEK